MISTALARAAATLSAVPDGDIGFDAENRLEIPFSGGVIELHAAAEVAVVRDRDRIHAEFGDPVHQSVDSVATIEQGILGVQMQVGKGHPYRVPALPLSVVAKSLPVDHPHILSPGIRSRPFAEPAQEEIAPGQHGEDDHGDDCGQQQEDQDRHPDHDQKRERRGFHDPVRWRLIWCRTPTIRWAPGLMKVN